MESNTTSDSFDYLAAARFAGWFHLIVWVLGLARFAHFPQAGVPGRASRLGWKSLCCRPLRGLTIVLDCLSWGLLASLAAPQALCSRPLRGPQRGIIGSRTNDGCALSCRIRCLTAM